MTTTNNGDSYALTYGGPLCNLTIPSNHVGARNFNLSAGKFSPPDNFRGPGKIFQMNDPKQKEEYHEWLETVPDDYFMAWQEHCKAYYKRQNEGLRPIGYRADGK